MSSFTNAIASLVAVVGACNLVAASPYMHGVTADGSIRTRLEDAAGKALVEKLGDREVETQALEAVAGDAVLCLRGEDTAVSLPQSIMSSDDIMNYAGRTLRVFVWMKGEDILADNGLWMGAPSVKLELYDGFGNVVSTAESLFKTRGTFPWHCYYVDIAVPKNIQIAEVGKKGSKKKKTQTAATDNGAEQLEILKDIMDDVPASSVSGSRKAGLYLTLTNFGGGSAWFAGLSYTTASASGSRVAENGCYAPNADYDELPMMLFYGIEANQKWTFLKGNKAQGSLLTVDGIRAYLQKNGEDWLHLQCGIANLPFLYNTANGNASFEEGWMDAFAAGVEALQDPVTGFWLVNGKPNILATAAVINGCYAPTAIPHGGLVIETPQYSMGKGHTLKYAGEMIDTVLRMRVNDGIPAWSADESDSVDMTTTAAACQILARAAAVMDSADIHSVQARAAIARAWNYAQRKLMVADGKGLWKDNSLNDNASVTGKGFFELAEATSCLDDRCNEALPRPKLEATISETDSGKVVVQWRKPEKELVAVRIFYAPKPADGAQAISSNYLVGVIERRSGADSILAIRRSADAARRQWGMTPEKAGAYYMDARIKALPKKVAVALAGKGTLKASIPADLPAEAQDLGFYAAGVNALGEMGPAFPIGGGDDTEEMIAAEEAAAEELPAEN